MFRFNCPDITVTLENVLILMVDNNPSCRKYLFSFTLTLLLSHDATHTYTDIISRMHTASAKTFPLNKQAYQPIATNDG